MEVCCPTVLVARRPRSRRQRVCLLLGSQLTSCSVRTWSFLCVCRRCLCGSSLPLLIRTPVRLNYGPPYRPCLITQLFKGPVSKYTRILRSWGFRLQYMNWGKGYNSAHVQGLCQALGYNHDKDKHVFVLKRITNSHWSHLPARVRLPCRGSSWPLSHGSRRSEKPALSVLTTHPAPLEGGLFPQPLPGEWVNSG